MRPFALLALLAATVYADGHLPTNSTMTEDHDMHDEDHSGDDLNTAEQAVKALDSILQLFRQEASLIQDNKINPKALQDAAYFRETLEMICEVSYDDGHEDEEHHEDADHNRMLDGHGTPAEHHEDESHEDMEEDVEMRCIRALKLLRSMEEYSKDDTTDERREEISAMWGAHLEDAFAEMFDGASTIATSVAGLATAVAILSF